MRGILSEITEINLYIRSNEKSMSSGNSLLLTVKLSAIINWTPNMSIIFSHLGNF